MIPDPLFYKLLLVGLGWLCLVFHLIWSDDRAPVPHATPLPAKPPGKRSKQPKPFAGLTHKPHCALCEQEIAYPKAPPAMRRDPMLPTNRRPREVDTSMHFCPYADCAYQGWLGLGNLRANGHPGGGPWRQFHCTSCEGYFLETHGTIFHGKRVPVADCIYNQLGLQSAHFSDHINCICRRTQDRIICN